MRIRTIKPEFFTHERLFDLERECGLPVRLAFSGLWCAADRSGRFKWEPRRLGVAILPYDAVDFSRVLDALATRGFIVQYRVAGVLYGCIPSFERHQVINNRERESEIPELSQGEQLDACPTREPRVPHAGKAEGKGREGNMEGSGNGRVEHASRDDGERAVSPEDIFAAYPKKTGKQEALKYIKVALKTVPPATLLATVKAYAAATSAWAPSERQFIPDPERWFKKGRWDDDPQTWERGSTPSAGLDKSKTVGLKPDEMPLVIRFTGEEEE